MGRRRRPRLEPPSRGRRIRSRIHGRPKICSGLVFDEGDREEKLLRGQCPQRLRKICKEIREILTGLDKWSASRRAMVRPWQESSPFHSSKAASPDGCSATAGGSMHHPLAGQSFLL